jgi:hypothetical protein
MSCPSHVLHPPVTSDCCQHFVLQYSVKDGVGGVSVQSAPEVIKQARVVATLWACNRELLLRISVTTPSVSTTVSWFSSAPPGKCWDTTSIRPPPFRHSSAIYTHQCDAGRGCKTQGVTEMLLRKGTLDWRRTVLHVVASHIQMKCAVSR